LPGILRLLMILIDIAFWLCLAVDGRENLMLRRFIICFLLVGFVSVACAQDTWDLARTTVNGKRVAIEYGSPRLNGRTLASLMKQLPPDRIWRAGAGPVTILTTETDLLIGGKKVPAGSYSLYMHCPEKGDYSLVINKDLDNLTGTVLEKPSSDRSNRPYPHFMDYTQGIRDKEVARIPLKLTSSRKTEILIYNFEPSGSGALLTISWGDQAWTVEFQPAG
jgi:hypothetical protein